MGFTEQLQEIIRRLPDTRQTLLFSATLPKLLVEFARAGKISHVVRVSEINNNSGLHQQIIRKSILCTTGLTDPVLVRLDVDSKLSDQLKVN